MPANSARYIDFELHSFEQLHRRSKTSTPAKWRNARPGGEALLPAIPREWTRSPALLELYLEVAEAHPALRTDAAALTTRALARARELRLPDELFLRSLSDPQ
jgi:hypothetical protein